MPPFQDSVSRFLRKDSNHLRPRIPRSRGKRAINSSSTHLSRWNSPRVSISFSCAANEPQGTSPTREREREGEITLVSISKCPFPEEVEDTCALPIIAIHWLEEVAGPSSLLCAHSLCTQDRIGLRVSESMQLTGQREHRSRVSCVIAPNTSFFPSPAKLIYRVSY